MFIDSIGKVATFTRPMHSIMKTYGGKQIIPGAATIFFINEEGYALTCKHVVDLINGSEQLLKNYNDFKNERDKLPRNNKYKRSLRGLEIKYKFNSDTLVLIRNNFLDCVDTMTGINMITHPKYDLALLKFNDFKSLHYTDYAIFKKDHGSIKQGKLLCRLGFPFPEFNNFQYNAVTDDIEWTKAGIEGSPRFPDYSGQCVHRFRSILYNPKRD